MSFRHPQDGGAGMLHDFPSQGNRALEEPRPGVRRTEAEHFLLLSAAMFVLHAFLMLHLYGIRPPAPVLGDEVVVNDPAVALSRGQGLVAPSFRDSGVGLDKLYAHFPPLFILVQSVSFRFFGVSVYSMRLMNTAMDLLAVLCFLLLMWRFCKWGLANYGTASIASLLYILNASVITLHRMARMEPMLELFLIAGFMLVMFALYGDVDTLSGSAEFRANNRSYLYLLAGMTLNGLALATHLEALTGSIPSILVLLAFSQLTLVARILLLLPVPIVPVTIWLATYRQRSWAALAELQSIRVENTEIIGIGRFARAFFLKTHRTANAGMQAVLFFSCLAVLAGVVWLWFRAERQRRGAISGLRLKLVRLLGASGLLALVLLEWKMSASITRYEAIFPVFLAVFVLLWPKTWWPIDINGRVAVIVALVAIVETAAVLYALYRDPSAHDRETAHRFDGIVKQIPPDANVAAMPAFWLAFIQQGRPVTMLYVGFDGMEQWQTEHPSAPLAPFDAVILDTTRIDEYKFYRPYATQGRRSQTFEIDQDRIDLYTRSITGNSNPPFPSPQDH